MDEVLNGGTVPTEEEVVHIHSNHYRISIGWSTVDEDATDLDELSNT
jgi:hypothetical protein